jgi:type IV pilus assembly protein PilF
MNVKTPIALVVVCACLQACASSGGSGPASDEEAALANLNLGTAYLRQGRPQPALEALDRALQQNPRLADAHATIALIYDQLGEPGQAEQHFRRATQLEPLNSAAANSYAVFLCRQNRWSDAERHFVRAAENPRYTTPAAAWTNAGTCARSANDLEKAERYFRAALDRNPNYPDALRGMMELSYNANSYLQARAFMQRLFAAAAPDARGLWMCFHIERELGDTAAAERCAAQLQSNFPASPEAARIRELVSDAGQ